MADSVIVTDVTDVLNVQEVTDVVKPTFAEIVIGNSIPDYITLSREADITFDREAGLVAWRFY